MFKTISTAEARMLIRERSPVILDVRDVAAYRDVRIPDAIHATLATLYSTMRQIARDTPLLIYCHRGLVSRDFAELFDDFGFLEVYSLEGGFHAWRAEAGEIERSAAFLPVVNSSPSCEWLLERGGDPDNADAPLADGTPPLIEAARLGLAEVVKALIDAGAPLERTDPGGNNALWAACRSGRVETVGVLLKAGMNPNRQNASGATVLMDAAATGQTELVALLLAEGADPMLRRGDNRSALDLAGNLATLKLLRKAARSAA